MLREVDPDPTRPVILVGHDLGAIHACHAAQFLQKRVKGVILFNGLSLYQAARRLKSEKSAAVTAPPNSPTAGSWKE